MKIETAKATDISSDEYVRQHREPPNPGQGPDAQHLEMSSILS